jgi:hypothetical protein
MLQLGASVSAMQRGNHPAIKVKVQHQVCYVLSICPLQHTAFMLMHQPVVISPIACTLLLLLLAMLLPGASSTTTAGFPVLHLSFLCSQLRDGSTAVANCLSADGPTVAQPAVRCWSSIVLQCHAVCITASCKQHTRRLRSPPNSTIVQQLCFSSPQAC